MPHVPRLPSTEGLSLARRMMIAPVRVYKLWVSPLFPPSCRFTPTCSEYMMEAIARHGVLRGGWMGLRRLGRCHPFHPGGHDPVPEAGDQENIDAPA